MQVMLMNIKEQARSQDRFGGAGPQKVDLLDPKSGLFEPHLLNPPTKTPFLAHFVAKSGPLSRFRGALHPRTLTEPSSSTHFTEPLT